MQLKALATAEASMHSAAAEAPAQRVPYDRAALPRWQCSSPGAW